MTMLQVRFMGLSKTDFSTQSESMKSATAFLAMSSASIRSLAMSGLAGTQKDKIIQFFVFKTRTEMIGEARNCL